MGSKKIAPKPIAEKQARHGRVPVPDEVRSEVARKCRRRCCMCYYLYNGTDPVDGQIAHLDQDNTNSHPDNLAYLCLECHKNFDRKSNRVMGYLAAEIKHYRDELHREMNDDQVEWTVRIRTARENYDKLKPLINSAFKELRKEIPNVEITEGPVS
jgi:hypothetical protein